MVMTVVFLNLLMIIRAVGRVVGLLSLPVSGWLGFSTWALRAMLLT
jgi:hypothetical protein